jgi:UDP-galactopyranose mutase
MVMVSSQRRGRSSGATDKPLLPISGAGDGKGNSKAAPDNKKKWGFIVAMLAAMSMALYISDPNTWNLDSTPSILPSTGSSTGSSTTTTTSTTDNRFKARKLTDYHDLCIVGAGLSGSVIAERYANERNQTSLIIERRDHIAGNCYDYMDKETGIRVSKYGAHLFHTYYDRVWKYVQKFSAWTPYEHEVIGLIDGKHVPIPVNIHTVNTLFGQNITDSIQMDAWLDKEQEKYPNGPQNSEEMAMSRVGKRLYELIFHPYTIKQWDKEPKDLGPEVTARIPVRNNYDGRYFADPHQALPSNGYTAIFEKMLDNPLISVHLNTDFFQVRPTLNCGKLYYTGPVDRYFADTGLKKLEYRSLDFERRVIKNVKHFQPKGVVNHPAMTDNFTRIVEYKHFLNQTSDHTILFLEHSKDHGEPYYPVPNPENKALFLKYKEMADKEVGVSFVGRLANYKYFNMDQTIENALTLFEDDTGTTDLVMNYCKGDLEAILKDWTFGKLFNNTYVYSTCGTKGSSSVTNVEVVNLKKGDDAWMHHFGRTDITFGAQNVFIQGGGSSLSVASVKESLGKIGKEQTFVDYAKLPFTTSAAAARNLYPESEFFASQEAIKRYSHAHVSNKSMRLASK